MRKRRGLLALLAGVVAVALCGLVTVPALAHEAVDLGRKGSVSVSMKYEGEPVGGGALALYRVGDVAEDDGNFSFALTPAFAGSGATLDDVTSADLAASLADYAKAQGVKADGTYQIASDGVAKASGLELGLYLVVQSEPADGYEACTPFLVSVPMNEGGAYVYDVDATPKVEPGGRVPEPEEPTEPTPTPEEPTEPTPTPEEPTPTPETPTEPTPEEPSEPTEPSGETPTPEEPSQPTEPTKPAGETPAGTTPTPGTSATYERNLPSTGDVTNLVPVIACVGVGVALVGCAVAYGKRAKGREE